jgi:hypothetical protein
LEEVRRDHEENAAACDQKYEGKTWRITGTVGEFHIGQESPSIDVREHYTSEEAGAMFENIQRLKRSSDTPMFENLQLEDFLSLTRLGRWRINGTEAQIAKFKNGETVTLTVEFIEFHENQNKGREDSDLDYCTVRLK